MRFNRLIFDNYLAIIALVCDNMEASGFVSSAPFAIIAPIGFLNQTLYVTILQALIIDAYQVFLY